MHLKQIQISASQTNFQVSSFLIYKMEVLSSSQGYAEG